MDRVEFQTTCESMGMQVVNAGSDWKRACHDGEFLCAVIADRDQYRFALELRDAGAGSIGSGRRVHGHDWIEYRGVTRVESPEAMRGECAAFLAGKSDIALYTADDLQARNVALERRPRVPGELPQTHWERVAKSTSSGWLAPLFAIIPGYWSNSAQALVLDSSTNALFSWSFGYAEHNLLIVFDDDQEGDLTDVPFEKEQGEPS